MFCVFGFATFLSSPMHSFFRCVFVLQRLTILFLEPAILFLIGSEISISIFNWLHFLHFFLFKLVHIIYRYHNLFKNSSSISLLIFTFLSFISVTFYKIYKRLLFTIKNCFFSDNF